MIYDFVATATITTGQAVSAQHRQGGVLGRERRRAAAVPRHRADGAGAGQAVSVLKEGHCDRFTVSSLNGDAIVYLSNTVGAIANAAAGGGGAALTVLVGGSWA